MDSIQSAFVIPIHQDQWGRLHFFLLWRLSDIRRLRGRSGFKASYLSGDPRTAGEVVHKLTGNIETSSDMTLPVAWALGLADAAEDGKSGD